MGNIDHLTLGAAVAASAGLVLIDGPSLGRIVAGIMALATAAVAVLDRYLADQLDHQPDDHATLADSVTVGRSSDNAHRPSARRLGGPAGRTDVV